MKELVYCYIDYWTVRCFSARSRRPLKVRHLEPNTPKGSNYHGSLYIHGPISKDIGTTLRSKYIPYSYMDPLGNTSTLD